jgi:hypothetical protein
MRLTTVCSLAFAALVAAMAAAPAPADAAPKKQRVAARTDTVVAGRPRARITVVKRSFLDPGTQVIPGTDPATLYVATPGQYPGDVLRYTTFDRMHDTLPGGFSAAGPPRNGFPWNW